jgi:hypothetical protein
MQDGEIFGQSIYYELRATTLGVIKAGVHHAIIKLENIFFDNLSWRNHGKLSFEPG